MSPNWDERYSDADFFYGKEPNDFLRESLPHLKRGGEVLSLGEGEGRNAVFLASQGFAVTAVDGSKVAIEKLTKFSKERGVVVNGMVSDLGDFEIGRNRWDAIISIWCHLPPALRKAVYRKSVEGLKQGGVVLIESYTPKQLEYKTGGPPSAEMMSTLSELQGEFKGFEELRGREFDRDVKEGKGHFGKSAVVQYIGKKLS